MLSVKHVPVQPSLLDEAHQTRNPISFESRAGWNEMITNREIIF